MKKQIKVIICAMDGEWSRENTDALVRRTGCDRKQERNSATDQNTG